MSEKLVVAMLGIFSALSWYFMSPNLLMDVVWAIFTGITVIYLVYLIVRIDDNEEEEVEHD